MWKRFQEKEETPQLNKVFKVFMKNGNASNVCKNALKKRGNTSLNKVFKVFFEKRKCLKKRGNTVHLNYKYWETTQKYSEIPDPFPVLRDFPK